MQLVTLELSGLMDVRCDGLTHVRISPKGRTKLGRALSNLSLLGFEHPIYGPVASMESWWVYCRGGKRDADILDFTPKQADRHLKRQARVRYKGFRHDILEGLSLKLTQNTDLQERLRDNLLPLIRYTHINGEAELIREPVWFMRALTLHMQQLQGSEALDECPVR